jgi:ketosteroid isomerase-like protein
MNQRKFFWTLLAVLPFFFSSCASKESGEHEIAINQDSVKMKIQAMEDAYAKAENAKNVDGIVVYYASDAQSMADDEPTRVGMDAIKAGLKKDMEKDTTGRVVSFETTGVWAAGNYVTETGTSTFKDKDGKVLSTGKYMTLFELRDGKYVAIRDIWNRDAPATK